MNRDACCAALLACASFTLLVPATLLVAGCASVIETEAPVLTRARIGEIVASPDRTAADRLADSHRKPEQILAFIGIRPGMVALDLSAGGGYTTELLARAVSPGGRVYGQSAPRNTDGPARQGSAAERLASPPAASTPSGGNVAPHPPRRVPSPEALAARAKNPAVANIIPLVRSFEDPVPAQLASAGIDLVTLMFNYHDLGHMAVDRVRMNRAVFAALRPGGIYVIADHAGRPGTGIAESGSLHRIEEGFLRQEVESAGFVLEAEGSFLRNPADPRDRNTPEPAQPKDGFLLKFRKPS